MVLWILKMNILIGIMYLPISEERRYFIMLNEAIFIGNLVKDVEVKDANGTAVAPFVVAVNGSKDDVSYISCVAFKKTAEALAKCTKKGSKVLVRGSIHTRTYENAKKEKVFVTEVLAVAVEFLDARLKNTGTEEASDNTLQGLPF